jgi:ubiquinone biosynthesis accessory factor UbiJ
VLSQLAAAPVNHVLRGETWALRKLQPHAGRTARFDVFPLTLCFTVRDDGQVAAAAPGAEADVTFRVTPPAAIRILAGDESAFREVAVSGDGEFAQAVQFVVRNARWDAEEDLSRLFGDSIGHRVAQTGRGVMQFQARVASSFARNLSDYWVEERPLIARRPDVDDFVRDVDTLRDDVERLAQRVDRLVSRSS